MTFTVRIPADVDREDRVFANLTIRQLAILTGAALALYGVWLVTRAFLPLPVFLVIALPVGVTAGALALGQRDGLSLDRLLLAAIRQRLQPRHRVVAPDGIQPVPNWLAPPDNEQVAAGVLQLPARNVTEAGVIDLGVDGVALVAVASTVSFALRTPGEQEALVAAFGRYLHSLTAPVQVLVRTERLDLSPQIAALRDTAAGLPHPALEAAAREHADYLDQLRRTTDLLRRQVLLVLREPVHTTNPNNGLSPLAALRRRTRTPVISDSVRRAAETRLVRRLSEATELLAPAGIVVTPLDTGRATAVLTAACNPDSLIPPSAGLAGTDEIITTTDARRGDDL
jgi:hypothetical protein